MNFSRLLITIGLLFSYRIFLAQTLTTTSPCGGSIDFLHNNDAVHLPQSNQIYSGNGFTWECWFKLTTPLGTVSRDLICAVDDVVYEDIWLGFGWTGGIGNEPVADLTFKVDGPNSTTGPSPVSCGYSPPGGFQTNIWYHAAGVMDFANHTAILYLNGQPVDTETVLSDPITRIIGSQLSWDVALAPGYPGPPTGGNMDEVRIWNGVRTAAEIAANYNQCLAGNEPNLFIYYRCNQSSGSVAIDASPNANNGTLSNLAAWSTQQATLTGANCSIGCCPILTASNDTTICLGNSAQLNASAGFTTYTWSPSSGISNIHIKNPTATPTVTTKYVVMGTYIDSSLQACTSIDSVTVNIGNSLVCTVFNYTTCNGQTITISPSVSGGSGVYTYNWGSGYNGSAYTTTPKADSIYSVSITDASGCSTPVHTGSITVLAPLHVSANGLSTCANTINIYAIASGGNGNYIYTWLPSNSNQNPLSVVTQTNMIYTVTVSDGCTVNNASDTAQLIIIPAPTINLPQSISGCSPVCINLANIPYDTLSYWKWNFGDGNISSNQAIDHCYYKSGNYNISFSYTTTLGCVKTVSSNSIASVFSSPVAAFTASAFQTDIFDTDINFYNESSGYSVSHWFFGDAATSNLQNPSHNYTATGTYPVMLLVQNNHGCTDTVTHEVAIKDIFTFYAPTAFTPNGDELNEVFKPIGTGWNNDSFKMLIFDRWGNLILSTANTQQGWDGRIRGQLAQEDVYVWKVDLKDVYNISHSYSGIISIIK